MADPADPGFDAEPRRWQAFVQRCTDPIVLLNRRRQIVFVNRAWEQATGISSEQAANLLCKRSRGSDSDGLAQLGTALAPPPAVRDGQASRARRMLPLLTGSPLRVEIDFLPLVADQGLAGVLLRLRLLPTAASPAAPPVPEKINALRESVASRYRFDAFPAELPATERVLNQARLAAQTRAPVLLVGEPGVGKHWLARAIHQHSADRERAFAAIDCAGLPTAALAAALFGPAGMTRRPGVGTIYLGHVSDLPRELQAHLGVWLVDLENAAPRLIGGLVGQPAELVAAGRLIDELACRLGTVTISIPPIRERLAELAQLVEAMLDRFDAERSKPILGLTNEAWDAVRAYAWPGNVRQLLTVLWQAQQRAEGERIQLGELPVAVQRAVGFNTLAAPAAPRTLPLKALLEQVERRLIEMALKTAKGKKGRAARILAIWRPLLLRRMEKLGIK